MTRPNDRHNTTWGPSPWWLAVALLAVAGGLAWWWPAADAPPSPAASAPAAPLALAAAPAQTLQAGTPTAPVVVAMAATSTAPLTRIPRLRDPNGDQTPDLADYVNEGERPTMAEVIQRLHAAGVRTGLGAFNPPGTRPPIIGLAVPENFELPPGYVRHHQATDDGQRIEPILMFSPDAQMLVINGRAVAVPADRVVPPELAPPGLPIRRIVVPAPVDGPR
ncbi:hypothetical protein [Roseateles sp. P5_E4]